MSTARVPVRPASRGGRAAWRGVGKSSRRAKMTALALQRWANTGPSKRRAYGRRAALARWGTKKTA